MKNKPGSSKKRKRSSSKMDQRIWLYLSIFLLLCTNIVFIDAILGFRSGLHFLPKVLHQPIGTFFFPEPSSRLPGELKEAIKTQGSRQRHPIHKDRAQEIENNRKKGEPLRIKKARDTGKPLVAIVIDDLGYNPDLAQELLALKFPLTASVLPNLPFSAYIAHLALEKGKEVILHLPMEPYDYPNARVEKGTLLTSMEGEEIRLLIRKALHSVKYAVGVNNHMGSRMVEDEEKMDIILDEIKKRGLFFVDSRTSPDTKVYTLAKRMGVKTAERDVFLDGRNDIEYIQKRLEEVADLAQKNGSGIAIGHLQPSTIEALRTYVPKLEKRGIKFVRLSEVVE